MTDRQTLGTTTQLELPLFHKSLEAKVDTGATTCCLHGVNVQTSNGNVTFSNPDLSTNVISIPLQQVVDVHSADKGAAARPVVVLDVVVAGQEFKQVAFNINDRSEMDAKILIGQNLLKQGNFVVDVAENQSDINLTFEPIDALRVDDELKTIHSDTMRHFILRNVEYDKTSELFTITFTRDALEALLNKASKD
jgi:hypothetical protein